MDLNQWYEKGITPDEYIKSLEKHKPVFHIFMQIIQFQRMKAFFNQLEKKSFA